jgi:hypothetical protein
MLNTRTLPDGIETASFLGRSVAEESDVTSTVGHAGAICNRRDGSCDSAARESLSGSVMDDRTLYGFQSRMGRMDAYLYFAFGVTLAAALLWIATVVTVWLIQTEVTYSVCDGPLLQLPPPAVHWPPQGHHTELIGLEQRLAAFATGVSVLSTFLLLYARPDLRTFRRTLLLLGSLIGSLVLSGFLWLVVQHHVLGATLSAFGHCL